jgi:hypothetical protein
MRGGPVARAGSPAAVGDGLRASGNDAHLPRAGGAVSRSGQHAEAWQRAHERLAQGQLDAATEELQWLIDRYDDPEARAALTRLREQTAHPRAD